MSIASDIARKRREFEQQTRKALGQEALRCEWGECHRTATAVRHWSGLEFSPESRLLCPSHATLLREQPLGRHGDRRIVPLCLFSVRIEPLCLFSVGSEGWIALECALFTLTALTAQHKEGE